MSELKKKQYESGTVENIIVFVVMLTLLFIFAYAGKLLFIG